MQPHWAIGGKGAGAAKKGLADGSLPDPGPAKRRKVALFDLRLSTQPPVQSPTSPHRPKHWLEEGGGGGALKMRPERVQVYSPNAKPFQLTPTIHAVEKAARSSKLKRGLSLSGSSNLRQDAKCTLEQHGCPSILQKRSGCNDEGRAWHFKLSFG